MPSSLFGVRSQALSTTITMTIKVFRLQSDDGNGCFLRFFMGCKQFFCPFVYNVLLQQAFDTVTISNSCHAQWLHSFHSNSCPSSCAYLMRRGLLSALSFNAIVYISQLKGFLCVHFDNQMQPKRPHCTIAFPPICVVIVDCRRARYQKNGVSFNGNRNQCNKFDSNNKRTRFIRTNDSNCMHANALQSNLLVKLARTREKTELNQLWNNKCTDSINSKT